MPAGKGQRRHTGTLAFIGKQKDTNQVGILTFPSIALLVRTIQVTEENRPIHRSAGRALFLSSCVILLLGFTTLSTIPLVLVLNRVLLAPAFYGFKTWLV
jgi:hypothetical protein